MKRIGLIDDEIQILKSLKRLFFKTEYECFYFNSADDLLAFLKIEKLDLIVTDIRMPGMDGIKLMKILRRDYPRIIRIALSGYSDTENILRAININLAKVYLQKPWDKDEVINLVDNIFYMQDKFREKNLIELVNSFEALPVIDKIFYKITDMIEGDKSIKNIAAEIEKDPILTTHILRIVNAAYYGLKIGSIHQAISYLGLINIKNIILYNSIFKLDKLSKENEILWIHSSITNVLVSNIYREIRGDIIPEELSTSGLLHNIGLILLNTSHRGEYKKIEELFYRDGGEKCISYYEEKILGLNHMELGSYLLDWWDFPNLLVEITFNYKEPEKKHISNRELVRIIHVASYFAWEAIGDTRYKFKLDRSSLDNLNIKESRIREILCKIIKDMNNKGE